MKEEDFIVGRWYTSTTWISTKAIKLAHIKEGRRVCCLESIRSNGTYNKSSVASSFAGNLNTFREVLISEIAQYLPKDHPDLELLTPKYVKCIKLPDVSREKLGSYSATKLGWIYEVEKWDYTSTDCKLVGETKGGCAKHRFVPATKEEYDAQFLPHIICEECQGGGRVIKAKLYPSGHTEAWETCTRCSGSGFHEDLDSKGTPEYVKCINPEKSEYYTLGTIYKTGKYSEIGEGKALYCHNTHRFIPATKEEYDAQSDTGLKEFPQTGYCLSMSKDLRRYLESKYGKYLKTDDRYKGFAWNTTSAWTIINYSDRKLYTIEQLEKFIKPRIPKEWCIQITPENVDLICEFLKNHKHEYKGYQDAWDPKTALNFYFCYPQYELGAYSRQEKAKGQEVVTTEQIMHVLTNNNQINNNLKSKENVKQITTISEVTGLKICGPNLSIRRGDEIRATTIRCSESKIKLGSINSPD